MILEHFRDVAAATNLPVNADFQNGYADTPEAVAANVKLCVATGVAGISIEDSTGRAGSVPLYDFKLAVKRIEAARAAIDSMPAISPDGSQATVLLVARCEAWLVDDPVPFRTSLNRLVAFAGAGADCLYAPGVTDPNDIAELVAAVAPKPLNVLVSSNNCDMTVAQLADLGVRRISVGGALARAAWAGFIQAAKEIHEQGSFKSFADATPFGELTDLFLKRS